MTGEELKAVREELGWTQSALASSLGTSVRAVKYYEAGQRSIPGPVSRLILLILDTARRLNATT